MPVCLQIVVHEENSLIKINSQKAFILTGGHTINKIHTAKKCYQRVEEEIKLFRYDSISPKC